MVLCLAACKVNPNPAIPFHVYNPVTDVRAGGMHTAVQGDTLWSLSRRYNVNMQDIIALNGLREPYDLPPGIRVQLPTPRQYRVRKGDTLYTVSRTFGTSTTTLARLNDLQAPYSLPPGTVLRLPAAPARTIPPPIETVVAAPVVYGAVQAETLPAPAQAAPVVAQAALPAPVQSAPVQPAPKPALQQAALKIPDKSPPLSGTGKFLQPVRGKVISGYGPKEGGLHNDGVNIRAARGTPVQTAENGVVVYTGDQIKGYGNLVLVRHADGWMSAYAHLDRIDVAKGQVLKRGQSLGTVGSTGQVDGPQLHFEIRKGTKALNPVKFI